MGQLCVNTSVPTIQQIVIRQLLKLADNICTYEYDLYDK